QTGEVTGRVTDAESGQPLSGAEVQALGVGGGVAARAITDANGGFQLTGLPPGTYAVTASTVGYETGRAEAVRVVAGETSMIALQLGVAAFVLNPLVVTPGRAGPERAIDAPASVSVVSEEEIDARPAVTPADHLRSTPGIDIISQGVQSTNVVTRGFNNIFSGALLTLTDYRIAGVPSLRVNVLHFVPSTSADLDRIEVVLGPGSALYGPNSASGVLHMITKSPLADQGTSLSFAGGEQDLLKGEFRTAHRLNDRFGLKLSGELLRADEWEFIDPVETAEAAKFAHPVTGPIFRANLMSALGISAADADERIARIGSRSFDIERWGGEARLDWQATESLTTVLTGGLTNVGNAIELTGLGAAQVRDWRYSFVQLRASQGQFFAQGYLNMSDAGETYLLRTGQPIVDESKLWVAQAQHGFALGDRQTLTYGADLLYTVPQTRGTINGIYEDEDETTEIGGYVQSQTRFGDGFELVLAGRVDSHSALPDPIFSPRAALVFKPAEDQAFRVTYNRAFSTPSSINQFLDLGTAIPDAGAAQLGYSIRVQGTGEAGFDFGGPGAYVMRSPFTPPPLGGPATLLPADATAFWGAAVQVVAAQAAAAGQPLDPQLVQDLLAMSPTGAQIGTMALLPGQPATEITALDQLGLERVEPIRESTTSTFEVGYKGVLAERLLLAVDGWYSVREDFVTPLTVRTPFLLLNGQQTGAFLVPELIAAGYPQAQAQAIAAQLAPGLAAVPLGVLSSEDINANGAQLLATYTNVDEAIDLWGSDIAATYLLTDRWSLGGNASWVSDDHFDTDEVGVVTLNAPTVKWGLTTTYRAEAGFNGELRARFNNEFPVQSGVFQGTECIEGGTAPTDPCVDSFTLFDVLLGYDFPALDGLSIQLNVQNVFDEEYRSFPGTPEIGRMATLRARYRL
ncbi:MAG: TonB-dependent receptor domain-containing protein, partial [Longimicrobiales bacterium]